MIATAPDGTVHYSPAFEGLIRDLVADKIGLPGYEVSVGEHLGGRDSRYFKIKREVVPEIAHHCGSLEGRQVLDFGCGTGSTTAALAEAGGIVTAFDIDGRRVMICERRLLEHGHGDRRHRCVQANDPRTAGIAPESYDVVLMNGVVEHIPKSIPGLRASVIRSAWSCVKRGGFLVVNDTPNRLSPLDLHTTNLWWIPYSRPGSRWAYNRSVKKERYRDRPGFTPGPRGLEEAGAWGATFWEVQRHLGASARCVNVLPGHNAHLRFAPVRRNRLRTLVEGFFFIFGVHLLRAPITAFTPDLTNLVFQKQTS